MYEKAQLILSAFDKALDKANTDKYKLSLQLSLNGFSFCLFDTERSKLSGLEAYKFQGIVSTAEFKGVFDSLISGSAWLKLSYSSTQAIIESPKTTLIPQPLFDTEHIDAHLKFNHPVGIEDTISFDRLPTLDAVNVFACPTSLYELINTWFPDSKTHHFASPLIESLLIRNKNREDGYHLYVHVREDFFDIVILNRNRLIFYNMFNYRSHNDFAYYIIYVIEQMKLNPETVDVILLGEISRNTRNFEILYKYVRNIGFLKRSEDFQYSYVFNDIREYQYYTLLNLHMCEL
nr:DUF3822 family protein [Bacteroidota bacterium]